MEQFLVVSMMIGIGAVIGGITNHLAIKMLFRPYTAKYILGKRIPFTPGLIPKRRQELAIQFGKMVVEHLLTPESLKRKLQDYSFQGALQTFISTELVKWMQSDKTLKEITESFGYRDAGNTLDDKIVVFLEGKYEEMVSMHGTKSLEEVLPPEWMKKINGYLPVFGKFICEKASAYFESEEGKQRLERMIDDFLMNKGVLGNMIQMFLGNVKVFDKVQPELIKFFNHEGTRELFENVLAGEWAKIKTRQVAEIETFVGKETIIGGLKRIVKQFVSIKELFDQPIQKLAKPFQPYILEALPNVLNRGGELAAEKIEVLMEQLQLQEIVREQVESFPVERLEDLILSISKREFKMITYLGALLGGIIGALQGIIVLFI